jgi:hypothetical protein
MTTTSRTRGIRDENPFEQYIVTMRRSVVGLIWRWRAELTTLAIVLAAFFWLWIQITLIWDGVALAAFAAVTFGEPHSRRFTIRRFWCVVTRHRFHRVCWEARLHTRSGRLPWVLWIRPTKVGERLHVWCLAGISAEDFTKSTDAIRSACYARDARVTRNPRWSHIVTIDIIRRDTLAAKSKVSSPLARLATVYPDVVSPALVPVAATGPDGPPAWPQEATTPPE